MRILNVILLFILLAVSTALGTTVFTVDQTVTTKERSWTHSVAEAGNYQIGMAWIEVTSGNNIAVEIFTNSSQRVKALYAPAGEVTRFETRLENLNAGDTITVKVSPNGGTYRIGYKIAFGTPTFDGLPVFDVATYGAVGNGINDDFNAIQAAVAAAKSAGGIVTFDGTKTYRVIGDISNSNIDDVFSLDDTSDIKIQGNGATLMLSPPDRMASIRRSENIQVDGFTVDYDPYPYYQGTITNINVANRTIDITVPARYDVPTVGANQLPDYASFFGRYFVPDGPGLRTGSGENIYIESMATNGGPRQIRIQVPETANGAQMQPRLQNAVNNGATEMVVPDLLLGHRGNYTILVTDSSRVKVSDILMYQAPHFGPCPMRNVGPVTFSNVDLLMKNPDTELYWSWRGGYSYVQSSRWGYLIEDGDWHASAFYDDLFAFFTRRQDVMAVNSQTLTLEIGSSAYLYAAGDWVSVWTQGQTQLLGMSRITSVGAVDLNGNFDVTLESVPLGTSVDDVVINEELYNRDTIVRNCTSTDVGTKSGTTRIRTGGHFIDCNFADVYLTTEFAEEFHPTRARNFVLENSFVRSEDNSTIDLRAAINPEIIGCTLDNTFIFVDQGTESAYLNGNSWINMTGDILDINNDSDVWLFGGSSRNGATSGLDSYVTKDGSSTISYSTPPDYPPAEPPLSGDITPPSAPTLMAIAGESKVTLDWTNSIGASTYTVYRSETDGSPFTYLVKTTMNSHVDAGAVIGQIYYYVVTAADSNGNESQYSNEVSATPMGIILFPVADAYVQGGNYANSKYGSSTQLQCKTDIGNESFTRQSYLRFDLSSLSGTVAAATLRLKVESTTGSGNTHTAYFVGDDSWYESALTWNTKPAVGAALDAAVFPSAGSWLQLDMTDQTVNELAGDQSLSTVLISDGGELVDYYSRQAAAGNRPELTVATADSPPPAAPAGLTPTTVEGIRNVSLAWADQSSSGVSVYGVYRSTTSGGPYTHLINTTANGYIDDDVEFNTTYYYVATAIDDSGYASGYSTEVSTMATGLVLFPVADTFVQGGSYANTNYGTDTVLQCKTDLSNESYTRQSYLRFDLSSLTGTIISAKLRLKAASTNSTGDTHTAYFVSDDTWGESTLNWNNKPDGSTILDSATHPGAADSWLQLDVTDQMLTELTGDQLFSTVLISDGTVLVDYHSKEAAAGSQPELVIETVLLDSTPPVAPTGLTAAPGDALVTLDWLNNTEPDLASYTVYRATSLGGPYTAIETSLFVSDYIDNTAVNDQTYYYVVTATDTTGNESLYSNEVSATPLVATMTHWKFDDGAGTTASDSSGNGNDGTILGASWTSGRDGGGLSFDGDGDIVVKFLTASTWPEYSIALWGKAASLGQDNFTGVFNNNSSGDDFQIDIDGSSPGNYRYKGASDVIIGTVSTDWVHLAVSCDGVSTSLYYNGVPVVAVTEARNVFGLLGVGFDRTNTGHFHGIIDDVRVYGSALSQSQVSDLYGSYFYKGDLNRSGRVDMVDIAELGRMWQDGYDMNTLLDVALDWLLDQGL